jgi:hypothetical protein
MSQSTSNHAKAPLAAAFVKAMREAFGEENVQVVYVKEGEVELGTKSDAG